MGRGIAVWDAGHVVQGEGEVLEFLFPIFTMGNTIGSPTVKCFRFVGPMRKLDNISVGQTYRWKARFVAFGDVFSFKIKVGVYEILAKK